MIEQSIDWRAIDARIQELTQLLQDPDLDVAVRQKLQREYSVIAHLAELHATIAQSEKTVADLLQQKEGADAEFAELIDQEAVELTDRASSARTALENLLYPADPLDDRPVFLEVRAGTGGQEAALFAGDLARMYMMYALRKGWHASLVDASETDLGGYREAVVQIKGKGVYGCLKHESGVHRVQRVPSTETAGRIHTSTATVAVLPEAADEGEINIDPKDLRIDVYRSSGAGGQHVNTTDSAVRITHIPTGVVVACQDERSQHKNKAKAMKILQSRLLMAQAEKQAAAQSAERKRQIGSGERSEKVRTYNFPQNRVSDHQVDVSLKSLDLFMAGHMDGIIDALREHDAAERRNRPIALQGVTIPLVASTDA